MSYYYLVDGLVRQTEKAVLVRPLLRFRESTETAVRRPEMPGVAHWFPKSAVGLWETADAGLVLGVEGWFKLPVGAGDWIEFGESAAAVIEMKRTARPVNLYEHIKGWVPG